MKTSTKIMKFKKLLVFLTVMSLVFAFCGCSESENKKDYPEPVSNSYVHDFANILSQTVINDVNAQGAALKSSTSAEVVIVTIETLDGAEVEQYAVELGEKWGVGDKDKDNGVIILLSYQDREIYVAVGYGLEGAIPDSKAGRIIDKYIGYLKDDDFSTALHGIYNSVISEAYAEYGLTPPEQIEVEPNTETDEMSTGKTILYAAGLIIIGVIYIIFFGKSGLRHMYIPMFFGGGRGGRGGGSSGGGGFGGGSFGGGGAGRKF